jgi:hypothetical protein
MTLLSAVVVENLAQFAREGFGLTGVSGLPAEEAAVAAREHGRLLTTVRSGNWDANVANPVAVIG